MGAQSDFFRDAYDLTFQVSPIILTGGIASGIIGGMLPISLLLGGLAGLVQGAISNGGITMRDFPWRFLVQPGTQVISQSIGEYPFANRHVAANATIEQPLNISYKLINPVNNAGGYLTKLPLFTSLQSSLVAHNSSGGTYTLIMPSLILQNCVMLDMSDATAGGTQAQIQWIMNFRKPLISVQAGQQAFNGLMNILSQGQQSATGAWSGIEASVGSQVSNLVNAL